MSSRLKQELLFHCWAVPFYAGFAVFFLVSFPVLGQTAAIFAFVPPLFIAWKSGRTRGIIAAVLADIVTLALLHFEHVRSWDAASLLHRSPGLFSVVLIAAIVGSMSDLRKRMHREFDAKATIEHDLRKSEAMVRGIFLAAPVGISLSKNRLVLSVNSWLCAISGFSAQEILNHDARTFYIDNDEYKRAGLELYGEKGFTEARWRRKDGTLIDVLIRMALINPEDPSAGQVVSVLDITKRKEAESALLKSEASFRSMFELTSEGVALINPATNRFVAANPAMCRLFGYTEEEFKTLTAEDITPPESKEILRRTMELLFDGSDVADHEGVSLKKDGTKVNVIVCCKQLSWKEERVFYITFKDVTFLKNIQHRLEDKNKEILDFMHAITHDLKKPLTVMKTICTMVKNETFGALNDEGKEALGMGDESISYMRELLNDLLASAQLEAGAGHLTLEEFDLHALVLEAAGRLKMHAEEKNAVMSMGSDLGMVNADKKGLTHVYMNLLGNAINYIGEGPLRTIEAGTAMIEGRPVYFVRDNGIGIPEESKKHLFQKFKRGANVGTINGTGLGLSIVKGIIEAHGGEIWAESELGKGTTFYFTLPGGKPTGQSGVNNVRCTA
jgi:PAS domain S-box-containing protein